MKSIAKYVKRVGLSVKAFCETFKYGGYKLAEISYLKDGNLLNGKNVIITGGGSGIGLAIANKLLNQGARVLICSRNEDRLNQIKSSLHSDNLFIMVWDITKIDMFESYFKEACNTFCNKIDILINNAGVAPYEFFPNVSLKEWETIYNTNARGTFFMTQFFYNKWKNIDNRPIKKIINISSQGAFVGATYPYRMSKWDIAGLTQGLGYKLAKDNILVNGIAPGIIKTEMQQNTLKQGDNIFCASNPLQRYAFPEEIGEIAVYLASDLSNFIVGQTIVIDGGYSLK